MENKQYDIKNKEEAAIVLVYHLKSEKLIKLISKPHLM